MFFNGDVYLLGSFWKTKQNNSAIRKYMNSSSSFLQIHKFVNYKKTFSQPDNPSAGSDDQDKLNFAVVTSPVVSPTLGTLRRVLTPLCDSPSITRPRRDRRPWEMKRG